MTSLALWAHRARIVPRPSLLSRCLVPTIETAAVVDAMHTAMNEVVIVWVVDLSAASVLTRAWSTAWKSPLDAPWLARPASPASSIFIPAATKAAELALMVPVVGRYRIRASHPCTPRRRGADLIETVACTGLVICGRLGFTWAIALVKFPPADRPR